jgi:hypothetical protein
LRQLLSDVPGNVDMVIFPNYVSWTTFRKFIWYILLLASLICGLWCQKIYAQHNVYLLASFVLPFFLKFDDHKIHFRRAVLSEMISRNLLVRYLLFFSQLKLIQKLLPNMYLSVCFWIFSVSSLRHAPLVHIFFFFVDVGLNVQEELWPSSQRCILWKL